MADGQPPLQAGQEPDAGTGGGAGERSGVLFVMTGASGVGKDTIRNAAMPFVQDLTFSISATTREQREGEEHGVQYYFLERDKFVGMIDDDLFLEYADFVGEYYGTPLEPVREALAEGRDVLLELELVGARQVKRRMPEAVMIFIAPPSLTELERRLRGRGTETEEKIRKRLARAREEIRALREFDYLIVNDDVQAAASLFLSIIRAERSRARLLSQEMVEQFLHEE